MSELEDFFATSRDFHRELSKLVRRTSYLEFAMASGTAAMSGAGVYLAIESDPKGGLLAVGLAGYATKSLIGMGRNSLRSARRHEMLAEQRQIQLEDLE